MRSLRLLADDLTGALDSAAGFASAAAPVPVRWHGEVPPAGSLAYDSATREAGPEAAREAAKRLAAALWREPGSLAYKKIDSLLRGREAEELDAILEAGWFERCIIAPAFPAQRRVTRGGCQYAWGEDGWRPVASDLVGVLRRLGHPVAIGAPGKAAPPGISVWNAEDDADLDAVVHAAEGLERVLFVGSGGLAAALARRHAGRAGMAARPQGPGQDLPPPVLGLFGTDHPAMRAQLEAAAAWHLTIEDAGDAGRLAARMDRHGVALASVAVAPGTARDAAAARIAGVFGALARRLDSPGTLVAAGGETLRGLCDALGAERLDVTGEILPGVPRSILGGGRWNGTVVVSKSGAFGVPDLLINLIAAQAAPLTELEA